MMRLRHESWQRLGATLCGFALGLQLMLSGFGLVIGAATAAGDPEATLGALAICHADGGNAPADNTPAAPVQHDHFAFCCLWHQVPAIQPAVAASPAPAVFGYLASNRPRPAAFTPGFQRGPVNARAPPLPV